MRAGDALRLLQDAYKGWSSDGASRLAAALSFYAIFAIAPLLIIVVEIAAMLLGGSGHNQIVRDQILSEVRPAIGDAGTKAIADIVQATFNQRSTGTLATIVAWVLFAVAATGLILAIQDALNYVWNVREKPGILEQLIDRAKAFAIIAAAAILVVAMGFATAIITGLGNAIAAKIVNALVLIAIVTLITAAIYKWLPRVDLSWHDVWFGSIVSSVLSVAGQYLIGLYLGRAATTSAYGAAGSLVAILLWLNYSAQLFLFGAEITKVYAQRRGYRTKCVETARSGASET